jgi:putative ABC transport system permease protein
VLACFLVEAVILAGAGGLVGLAVGFAGTRTLVAIWPALPATPPVWAVVAALLLSIAIGALFGWAPARRATRLDPIVALAKR